MADARLRGLISIARHGNYDRATVTGMLDTAQAIAEDRYLPHAAAHEPVMVAGATDAVVACPSPTVALANATIYLEAFGYIVIAWIWLWQARVAADGAEPASESFYAGKRAAFRYFFRYELPKVHAQLALVQTLDDTCVTLENDLFVGA